MKGLDLLRKIGKSRIWSVLCRTLTTRRVWLLLLFIFFCVASCALWTDCLGLYFPYETYTGPAIIIACLLFPALLWSNGYIEKSTTKGLYGGLLATYMAMFAIAWVQYQFSEDRFSQKAGILTALSFSANRQYLANELSELSRYKILKYPSLFSTTQILYSVFDPERSDLYFGNGFQSKRTVELILNTHKTWGGSNFHQLDMSDMFLSDFSLLGAEINKRSFERTPLHHSDFRGCTISEFDHDGLFKDDFRYTRITGGRYQYNSMNTTRLDDIDFSHSKIFNITIHDVQLRFVDMSNSLIESSSFKGSTFIGVDLSNTCLSNVSFYDASLFSVFIPNGHEIFVSRTLYDKSPYIFDETQKFKVINRIAVQTILGHDKIDFPDVVKTYQENGVCYYGFLDSQSTFDDLRNNENINLRDTIFHNCDLSSFWIMGLLHKKAIRVDDDTTDQDVIAYCVDKLAKAKAFYETKLPKHVELQLREKHPELFPKWFDYTLMDKKAQSVMQVREDFTAHASKGYDAVLKEYGPPNLSGSKHLFEVIIINEP